MSSTCASVRQDTTSLCSGSGCAAAFGSTPAGAVCWASAAAAKSEESRKTATLEIMAPSMLVLHPTVFADSEAFAILPQLLLALLLGLAGLQALRRGFVHRSERPVALDVVLPLLLGMRLLRLREHGEGKQHSNGEGPEPHVSSGRVYGKRRSGTPATPGSAPRPRPPRARPPGSRSPRCGRRSR